MARRKIDCSGINIYLARDAPQADADNFTNETKDRSATGSGTIWEWYDVPVRDSEREILNTLAHAKKVTLRHEGRQYYKDRIISPAERKRIAEMLTAYEAILASKTPPR